jgi:predicted metallopeptidase
MIQYDEAPDIRDRICVIASNADFGHVILERLSCVRSKGSSSRRVIARCYALPRIMQKALNMKPHYIIEVISERFDGLSEDEKTKTLIHELMHIPKSFGGGFLHHDVVNARTVEKMWKKLKNSSATDVHGLTWKI